MIRLQDAIGLDRADEYLAPLARLRPALAERGIVFDSRQGDVVFADGYTAPGGPENSGPPLILFDRDDGGFLWWLFRARGDVSRSWLLSDRVLALMKISRYRSLDDYNDPSLDERVHVRRIHAACPEPLDPLTSPSRPRLDAAAYSKILLGHGFWAFDVCAPQAEPLPDLEEPRGLDVFCSLTVDYACPAITWHRLQVLERLGDVGRRVFVSRGRVLTPPVYHEIMRRARICVSPWGWGETCHRDYEALLAGCVLIKPRTEFIDSRLPLDESHYVACEPDFSDLPERIDEVLQTWPSHLERRHRGREYVLNARRADRLADEWAASIETAMRRLG